jgi:hypothetical protein
VNSGYFTVRKGGGVEARRLMRVLFETEADRVLLLHVRVLLVLDQRERTEGVAHAGGARAIGHVCGGLDFFRARLDRAPLQSVHLLVMSTDCGWPLRVSSAIRKQRSNCSPILFAMKN